MINQEAGKAKPIDMRRAIQWPELRSRFLSNFDEVSVRMGSGQGVVGGASVCPKETLSSSESELERVDDVVTIEDKIAAMDKAFEEARGDLRGAFDDEDACEQLEILMADHEVSVAELDRVNAQPSLSTPFQEIISGYLARINREHVVEGLEVDHYGIDDSDPDSNAAGLSSLDEWHEDLGSVDREDH